MPRLPGISQKDAVRVFQKLGYLIVRESGHLILSNGERRLVIPSSSASCSQSNHMRLGPLWQQPSLTQVAPCSRLFAEPARLRHEGAYEWPDNRTDVLC
jgi:predicted RNA binding protein YcfA (HicA-like mRNA interferase family)